MDGKDFRNGKFKRMMVLPANRVRFRLTLHRISTNKKLPHCTSCETFNKNAERNTVMRLYI